jgi:hypothetical protein
VANPNELVWFSESLLEGVWEVGMGNVNVGVENFVPLRGGLYVDVAEVGV